MELERKSDYFADELKLIKRDDYREFVRTYLDVYTPEYFWTIGASSSGKFHPAFAKGDGGLVRHTKAAIKFAVELMRMNTYMYMDDEYKDYTIMALICHDTCKYGKGEFNKDEYADHPLNARLNMEWCWEQMFNDDQLNEAELPTLLGMAVEAHMGQWGKVKPFTTIDRLVHLSDYLASRDFIDIPALNVETYDD